MPHGAHRDLPRLGMTSQDHHGPVPGTCLPDGARRQELLAVSHADQSGIIASILSRRPEGMWSHLACGTGMHRIRHEAWIHRENVTEAADVRVATPRPG